jgi:L-iditol 2-dehydrogenase
MRIARAYSIEDVRLEDVPMPQIGPDDALLKVEACGLCTSDCLDWYVAKKAPIVLGHEPTGTVVKVGNAVRGITEGMRVFTHHHVSCGECPACRAGADTSCRLFRETALEPGGFAQYLRIPGPNLKIDTLPLPDSMDWETGTWIEPLACSLRVFQKAPLSPGALVLIIGLGSMGLLNGMAARAKGAACVVGSDPVAVRREKAVELGFDASVDPLAGPLPESLERVAGRRGADVVVVGPGIPAAIQQGMEAAAPGGTVVLFTPTPPTQTVALSTHALYFSELRLTASYSCGPAQTREALDLLVNGRIDPRPLVTHRTGLAGVQDAIRRTLAKGTDLKAIVYPQE